MGSWHPAHQTIQWRRSNRAKKGRGQGRKDVRMICLSPCAGIRVGGMTELSGDEGDGRVLTIGPPWVAGFHQRTTTLALPRSRDAARRPLNGM